MDMGQVMKAPQLNGWQITTLILGFMAVLGVCAVAFILGKDAVISLAVILVIGIALSSWLIYG